MAAWVPSPASILPTGCCVDGVPSFFPEGGGRSQEEGVTGGDGWLPLPFEWMSVSLSDSESGDNAVLPARHWIHDVA